MLQSVLIADGEQFGVFFRVDMVFSESSRQHVRFSRRDVDSTISAQIRHRFDLRLHHQGIHPGASKIDDDLEWKAAQNSARRSR
jgi:hypothetical protein